MLKDIDQNEVAKYNHINGLHLLKESYKNNRFVVKLNRSQYRFLMYVGLIERGSTGAKNGMRYTLSMLGRKEMKALGVCVKDEPLRTCRVCGREANTVEELELFEFNNNSKYNRANRCRSCLDLYNMKGKRLE